MLCGIVTCIKRSPSESWDNETYKHRSSRHAISASMKSQSLTLQSLDNKFIFPHKAYMHSEVKKPLKMAVILSS